MSVVSTILTGFILAGGGFFGLMVAKRLYNILKKIESNLPSLEDILTMKSREVTMEGSVSTSGIGPEDTAFPIDPRTVDEDNFSGLPNF